MLRKKDNIKIRNNFLSDPFAVLQFKKLYLKKTK